MVCIITIITIFNFLGSAIGIKAQFWEEDSLVIVDLCIDKMNNIYLNSQKPQLSQEQLAQLASDKKSFQASVTSSSKMNQPPSRSFDMFSFISGVLVATAIASAFIASRK